MSTKYVLGQVASAISSSKDSSKNKNVNSKLVSLFSAPPKKRKSTLVDTNTAKRKKRDDDYGAVVPPSQPADNTPMPGFCPPPGIVHEALQQQTPASDSKKRKREAENEGEESQQMKRKPRHRRDKTKDNRTVFVGNVPLDTTKKIMKKLFKEFGEIENLRFRCPPIAEHGMRKRESMTTKKFHPKRHNMICYVCFKDEEAAQKSLSLNGYSLNDYHLRVDVAANSKKHESKLSVFVGNLSFDIEEEALRDFFRLCGEISYVRVIRDSATSMGKGFAYVAFKTPDDVERALRLNGQPIKGRPARVNRCQKKPKKDATSKTERDNKPDKQMRKSESSPGRPDKRSKKDKKPKVADSSGRAKPKKGRKEDSQESKSKKMKFLPTNVSGRTSFSGKLGKDKMLKKLRRKKKLQKMKSENVDLGITQRNQASKKFRQGSSKSGKRPQKRNSKGPQKKGKKNFKSRG